MSKIKKINISKGHEIKAGTQKAVAASLDRLAFKHDKKIAPSRSKEKDECDDESINVPDNAFEQYLINQDWDTVLDNCIATANIADISILEISGKEISTLKGIEGFTALKVLMAANNSLVEIDLEHNTMLEILDVSDNDLMTLDLHNNSALKFINATNNNLSTLNLDSINPDELYGLLVTDNNQLHCIETDEVANFRNRLEHGPGLHAGNNVVFNDSCCSIDEYTDCQGGCFTDSFDDALADDVCNDGDDQSDNPTLNLSCIEFSCDGENCFEDGVCHTPLDDNFDWYNTDCIESSIDNIILTVQVTELEAQIADLQEQLSAQQSGDINLDGHVNISDIIVLVNIILANDDLEWTTSNRDINQDIKLDVSDIVRLTDTILDDEIF